MKYLGLILAFWYCMVFSQIAAKIDDPITHFNRISTYLETLNETELSTLLEKAPVVHAGMGGTAVQIEIDGVPVFVKRVPLNEIEGKEENTLSTKNLFDLPLYYQYGVGSEGFSVWREVATHLLTTKWVLTGENANFPLLYHWRKINQKIKTPPLDEGWLTNRINYWDGSFAIGERLKANHNALAYVALFLEFIPETLDSWLAKQAAKGGTSLDDAMAMVERNLFDTIAFMNSKGLLHFDAHFKNILTDGKRLYFSDFGLASSAEFDLSSQERKFFYAHQDYDRYFAAMALVDWIIYNLFGEDRYDQALEEYGSGRIPLVTPKTITPFLSSILKRYAPVALRMHNFFKLLQTESKQVPYPADELNQIWNEIEVSGK